jgi:hypothetical protein
MNLIIASVISWLLGLAILLLPFYILEGKIVGAQIRDPSTASLLASVLTFALLNMPGLFCLRKHCGEGRDARLFPAVSALIINAPVLLIVTFMAGRTLSFSEAFLFVGAFVVVGIAFGLGFVWSYQENVA